MKSFLTKLPIDKVAHFLVGGLLFAILQPFDTVFALIIVALIAAAKEIVHDKWLGQGTPDGWDFLWTVAGGVVAAGWLHFVVPFLQRLIA